VVVVAVARQAQEPQETIQSAAQVETADRVQLHQSPEHP
jgi:hypothetical protein